MVKIVLCICTCRRPHSLSRLLHAVAELEYEGALSIVVVDNDRAHEGLAVCRHMAKGYRWPLACVVEPHQGISYARNCAVQVALAEQPAFIAMLDDDEWPSNPWLHELLRVQARTHADVVGGPVLPVFPAVATPWSKLVEFYGVDQRRPDGQSCVLYAAGNFLARATCFQSLMPAPFDPAFARSGGEDLVFFQHLARRGYTMSWSTEGIVYEEVPPSRMTLTWLQQRQRQRGNTNVIAQRLFAPGIAHEALRLVKTVGLLCLSIAFYVVALPHWLWRIRAVLLLHKAIGKLMAHVGYRYLAYTTIHGH